MTNAEDKIWSEVGASSAHRWRPCSGSRNLIKKLAKEGLIKGGSSRAAAEGSAAHLVLETYLNDSEWEHDER